MVVRLTKRHGAGSNYSFKPNPLRGIACVPALRLHAFAATARVGLTQVLGAFMSINIALAIALATGAASAPELCSGFQSKIEPDMRIQESDLSQSAATLAADKLRAIIDRGQVAGESHFGLMNQLKTIQGYALLKQAQADREKFGARSSEAKDSTARLCKWLVKDGFWYD